MPALDASPLVVTPLGGHASGVRITGVTRDNVADPAVQAQLRAEFERAGLIIFADVEPTGTMHVAISEVFGPLKAHPSPMVPVVEGAPPGVIDMVCAPYSSGSIEVGGRELASFLPWHFDHAYNNELNRAGVLRAIDTPPEGGLTGFVDGIALYNALSPDLRARIEGRNVIYRMNTIMDNLRFGRPADYRVVAESPHAQPVMDAAKDSPRAVHPAVWTRPLTAAGGGEKVLHVSPWMAEGIEGAEDAEGDALLGAVCREIFAAAEQLSYFHRWSTTDMLIWDNWRVLHAVSGHDPQYHRRMQRTTIKGDYGLGYFEGNGTGSKVLEMAF